MHTDETKHASTEKKIPARITASKNHRISRWRKQAIKPGRSNRSPSVVKARGARASLPLYGRKTARPRRERFNCAAREGLKTARARNEKVPIAQKSLPNSAVPLQQFSLCLPHYLQRRSLRAYLVLSIARRAHYPRSWRIITDFPAASCNSWPRGDTSFSWLSILLVSKYACIRPFRQWVVSLGECARGAISARARDLAQLHGERARSQIQASCIFRWCAPYGCCSSSWRVEGIGIDNVKVLMVSSVTRRRRTISTAIERFVPRGIMRGSKGMRGLSVAIGFGKVIYGNFVRRMVGDHLWNEPLSCFVKADWLFRFYIKSTYPALLETFENVIDNFHFLLLATFEWTILIAAFDVWIIRCS